MRHILTFLIATAPAAACSDAEFARGTAKACGSCTWDGDCADGLFCDETLGSMVCRTPKMAEALADAPYTPQCDRDCRVACVLEGKCHVLPRTGGKPPSCQPASKADCDQAKICGPGGYCQYCAAAQDGAAICRAECP